MSKKGEQTLRMSYDEWDKFKDSIERAFHESFIGDGSATDHELIVTVAGDVVKDATIAYRWEEQHFQDVDL